MTVADDPARAVRELVVVLRSIAGGADTAATDDERIGLLEALTDLAPAASAAALRVCADHDVARRSEQAAAGVTASHQGRGVARELGLATRTSHHRAKRRLSVARTALAEMPHAFDRLTDGTLREHQLTALLTHTACVDLAVRTAVDEQLCADPSRLAGLGERQVDAEAARLVARLDPAGVARRAARASRDRHVSSRPAPDLMCRVSALLPVEQGVAVVAALRAAAGSARAAGDPRTRGQVMADTLVQRTTGQATADAVPLAVQLILPAASALPTPHPGASATESAWLIGHGPVDALTARALLEQAWSDDATRALSSLRRLWADPATGTLVAMDSRSRAVPAGLAAFVHTRDLGICRTPWCDAPVRHTDHVVEVAIGGASDEPNLQGLCEACNYAKEAPGWSHHSVDDTAAPDRAGPHEVVTTTPSGRSYISRSPDLPGAPAPPPPRGRLGPATVDFGFAPVLLDCDFAA
ncbi:HNH endonuclease [Nocardioides perillae]|uniref:HNH nuclease domain-containing protein n=1 Tax=Nocardioides perillae TaxID=1119534 RepID=A0A7Y9RT99_9ACTN|nr:DUF222 domain-containing protein [Nocardioides perillae]NYG53739.1 hypothetical protein [Nocardioides perillae]